MIQFYSGQLDAEIGGQLHEEALSLLYKGQENVELKMKLDYEFKI